MQIFERGFARFFVFRGATQIEIARLSAIYDADTSGFDKGTRHVESELNKAGNAAASASGKLGGFSSSLKSLGGGLSTAGSAIGRFGLGLSAAVTLPIASLATLGLSFNSTKEQALIAFGVMLKSGEKAKALYADLLNFAATTPFQAPEVVGAAKVLKAFGFEVEELKPLLTDVGNLASVMGARFEDVAKVFGRLKSGDFGEAFERLRDFGISRAALQGEGLVFDKSGEYQGSVETALKGVRALIQRDFGGMMDAQSKTLSGRMSTLWDTINQTLGDATGPLFEKLSAGLGVLIGWVDTAAKAFTNLSPGVKSVIVAALGLAAALGPVLLVIGGVITALGSIATGLAGLTATGTVMAGLTAVATGVGIAILAVIGLLIQMAPVLLVAAAGAATLYTAWKTNFGGLQTFVLQAFETIKNAVSVAMAKIQSLTETVGGKVVTWWNQNYPLIQATVSRVSERIKSIVNAFLTAVQGFWATHGERIMAYVTTAWKGIQNYVGRAVEVFGNILRTGLLILSGDWKGGWDSFLVTLKSIFSAAVANTRDFVATFGKFLMAAIPIVVEWGVRILLTMSEWVNKAVAATVIILATLPYQLIKIVPKLIAAGMQIGAAIWEGIKKGLAETASGGISGEPLIAGLGFMGGASGALSGIKEVAGNAANAIKSVGSATKDAKKAVDDLNKSWSSSQMQAWAEGMGFKIKPGQAGGAKGHQAGSKHAANKALDIGLNSNPILKNTTAYVDLLVKSLKAGMRVVDERFKVSEKWTAPHAHLEENDKRKSFFDPRGLSGLQLETLKALDAKRIAGDLGDVAGALDGVSKMADPLGDLIAALKDEFAGLGVTTKAGQVALQLAGGELKNYTAEEKNLALAMAKSIDLRNSEIRGTEQISQLYKSLSAEMYPVTSALDQVNEALAGADVQAAISSTTDKWNGFLAASVRVYAAMKDLIALPEPEFIGNADGTGSDTGATQRQAALDQLHQNIGTPPDAPWKGFFGRIQAGIVSIQGVTASWATNLEVKLGSALSNIGDIFSNAVQSWDGTLSGFFKNIGMGFAQMAQQIVSELLKIAVMKLVMQLIGGIAGGLGGGSLAMSSSGGAAMGFSGFGLASGGIPPMNRLSLVGERGPELFVPNVGGRILSNSDSIKALSGNNQPITQNIHMNFHSRADGTFSRQSAEQAGRTAIATMNRYSKKSN